MIKPSIQITTDHPDSLYGVPVCLISGKLIDPAAALVYCTTALGWTWREFAEATNKSEDTYRKYRGGRLNIPAEVWLVIRDALKNV